MELKTCKPRSCSCPCPFSSSVQIIVLHLAEDGLEEEEGFLSQKVRKRGGETGKVRRKDDVYHQRVKAYLHTRVQKYQPSSFHPHMETPPVTRATLP